MGVISHEMKDGILKFSVDSNEDGEKVLDLKLNVNEGLQEIMKKGEPIEGAKIVDFEFSATKLVLKIDSDRDGEHILEMEVDLMEAFDEVKDAVL